MGGWEAEDSVLLALKMEEGAGARVQAASSSQWS
jgi:hypothetical protein